LEQSNGILDANIKEMKNEGMRLEMVRTKIEKLIMDNNTIKDLESLRKELRLKESR